MAKAPVSNPAPQTVPSRGRKSVRTFMGKQNFKLMDVSSEADGERAFQVSMGAILSDLQAFIAELDSEIVPGVLVEALEPTLGKAIEYCPVDSGALVASAYLEVEKYRGNPTVYLGFGRGGNPSYALAVHERTDVRHAEPTRAKFLQSALDEDYYSILNSIPRLIREYSGTSGGSGN